MAAIQRTKKVCLITPGHISSNPRLVKEANALSAAGYQVHLIFTQYLAYLAAFDTQLLTEHSSWTHDVLDWTNTSLASKSNRLISRLMQRLSNKIEVKINRNYNWQLKAAISIKADLYIAHNPGALAVAVNAATANNAKKGFDAEDFHRNEVTNDASSADVGLKTAIEDKYVPLLNYLTASSPQIAQKYSELYSHSITTILNVFPKINNAVISNNRTEPLRLFWFSQTVGPHRGLEAVVKAIGLIKEEVVLTLLGAVSKEFKTILQNSTSNNCSLYFKDPVFPDDLFNNLNGFDIGFASETGFSLNNDLALSNKLFTYLQCGIAIAASNTTAQQQFMHTYPSIGFVYRDVQELAEMLSYYHNNREALYQARVNALELGQQTLNWENESKLFLRAVQSCLA